MKGLIRSSPVIFALIAVVGWPLLATVLEATKPDETSGSGTGEIVPTARAGEIIRPLGLAFQTARLVLATEAMALPVGVALAIVLFRTDVWGRRGMLGVVALAAFVPMPLTATAWLGALGNAGRSQAMGLGVVLTGVVGRGVHPRGREPPLDRGDRRRRSPGGRARPGRISEARSVPLASGDSRDPPPESWERSPRRRWRSWS